MGLSNQERYVGMLKNVEEITDLSFSLTSDKHKDLKNHVNQLWIAFRSPYSDHSGYFQKSDYNLSDDRILSFENPTYVAFDEVRNYYKYNFDHKINFDDQGHLMQCLKIDHVINDSDLSCIVSISNCIRLFHDYINRYDDNFCKRFEKTNSIISLIEREIYIIFRDNHKIYDAWIVSNMLKKIINVFDDEDILYEFIKSKKHDFRLSEEMNSKLLSEWYLDKIQNKSYKDFNLTERLEILLTILGRRFYNLGDHEKLLLLIKDQDIEVEIIQSYLNTCIEKRKNYDESNTFLYNRPCYLRD